MDTINKEYSSVLLPPVIPIKRKELNLRGSCVIFWGKGALARIRELCEEVYHGKEESA